MRQVPYALLGICWGLVAIVWLAGAAYNARRAPGVSRRADRAVLVGGAIVAVLVAEAIPRRSWDWANVHGWPIRASGVAVLLVSTAFALWARLSLGVMWSSTVVLRDEHRLQTGGPYAITRHPIYTGLLGMVLGTALIAGVGRWSVVFVVALVVVELKLRAEERLLAEAFPADYERYRRRVPQLVPGLRRRGGS